MADATVVHRGQSPEFTDQGGVAGYTGILQDVTDRRQAEDQIRQLAHFDSLTGLPNRRQLIWRVRARHRTGAPRRPPGRAAADRPGPLQDHQ